MDAQVIRRHRAAQIQDQENVLVTKGKATLFPAKKQGLSVRGPLGELSANVQALRDVNVSKVAVAAAEYEKKARGAVKSNYSHVQSKVDTGRPTKNVIQPSSRPPLRREESTAGLAGRAIASTKAALKCSDGKESFSITIQTKKLETKKTSKLPTVKENKPANKVKPILKESTDSLGKLKLEEKPSLINLAKLEKHASLLKQVENEQTLDLDTTPQLPNDIEDIDAKDNNSPLLMTPYIQDIYRWLKELEEKYPVKSDYLKETSGMGAITGKMRATLIDWLVEVQKQFALLLETFQLTVGILDRYLQVVPNIPRNKLQLVGVTAMFIASKYEEVYAPDIGDFVYVTDNTYTKDDIFRCEREILSKLTFCLGRPIPLSFLRRYVKAAHGNSKNHHLAKYLVDLCLVEYSMVHYRPSELAAASICLSLYLLSSVELKDIWTPTLSYYSGYTLDHIKPIICKIAKIVADVEKSKYKAVYNKYQDPLLAKVSNLPQLKSNALKELALQSSSP